MRSTTTSEHGAGRLLGAVELGGSKVLCAVGSARKLLAEASFPTTTPEPTLAAVTEFFTPYRERLDALGIAAFGPIELDASSSAFGTLLATPKPGWSATPLSPRFVESLGVPVAIDTDVNAAALAEQQLGAGEGCDPCLYVTVGTGIGVGVVSGGVLLHGLLHPELGHLPAPTLCDFEGCCPFHGRCIEGVASGRALAVQSGVAAHELADDDPVWELEARYLAHLLAACVLAHAPRRIVLGGGVLERPSLRARTRAHLLALLAGYVPRRELTPEGIAGYVRAPALGQQAGLRGAFLLAEAVFSAARRS